jgi:ankyrin repeat protein
VKIRFTHLWLVLLSCLLLFCSCRSSGQAELTPAGAKDFLKLRGYPFDEKHFLEAVAANDVLAVKAFLLAGINPNAKDESEGDTALITAATAGNLEIVNALIQGRADVNAKNKNGIGALTRALIKNHEQVSQSLLAQPAIDINVPGENGASVLMVYVYRNREEVVTNLLQRGANVNLQDMDGDTALHGAVKTGNLKVLRLLLAKGARVNTRSKLGATPLMWAGGYGQDEAARILLENGADPKLKDEQGRTAADWAEDNRHHELGDSLRTATPVRW